MPTVTPDQGLSLPIGPDVADNPAAFINFVAGVEPRLVRLYTDAADRTARQLVVAENELSALGTENRVEIYNGTDNISLYERSLFSHVRTTAVQNLTISSTVLQNVTNMVVAVPGTAGAVFQWRCKVFYASATAADIKFAYTIPAGATMRWGIMGLATTTAAGSGDVNCDSTAVSGTALPLGGAGVGTILWCRMEGGLIMGATGGNLQLQSAQNTSDATQTTIQAFSDLEIWRVA